MLPWARPSGGGETRVATPKTRPPENLLVGALVSPATVIMRSYTTEPRVVVSVLVTQKENVALVQHDVAAALWQCRGDA